MDPFPRNELLRVDLTEETVTRAAIPEEWRRRFVGGKGLAARYLYETLSPGTDPLGPENALVVMCGPLTGLVPGEPRFAAVTKSPLTGTFLDSYCGGTFADRLPGALEAMGVLITGRSRQPTTLVFEEGDVQFRDATGLWGRDVRTTDDELSGAVACVGPAGEHTVRYATIATDGGDHHAGRGGAGAVMGSKRLKAIIARGPDSAERLENAPAHIGELRAQTRERFAESETGRWLEASGTMETVDAAAEASVLPTRGWRDGSFEGADGLGIEAVSARGETSKRERSGSTSSGDFVFEGETGDVVPRGGTPIALGSGIGIDDFDAVVELGETCDRLGLDVIGAGNAVAWVIRAHEKGILEGSRLDAISSEPSFGDPDTARAVIESIATRDSALGDALADGIGEAATRFDAPDLAPTIKGMTIASYDPRGSPAMALAFATSDRGACHRRARPVFREAIDHRTWTPKERADAVSVEQDTRALLWSLLVDDFVGETFWGDLTLEWLGAAGLEYDERDLETLGERIWTLTRLFNVREGVRRRDDSIPAVLEAAHANGTRPREGVDLASFENLLTTYYAAREWGADGVPTRGLLERLGLLSVVDERTPVADEPATAVE